MLRSIATTALLLASSPAAALPWYVADEDDAHDLQSALDELWAGHPITVELGSRPADEDGIERLETDLVLVSEGIIYDKPTDGAAPTEVLLVRSWLREIPAPEGAWAPSTAVVIPPAPPVDPAVPEPTPEPPPPPASEAIKLGWNLFVGIREATNELGFVDSMRVGVEVGPGSWQASATATIGTLTPGRLAGSYQPTYDLGEARLLARWSPAGGPAMRPDLGLGLAAWNWREKNPAGEGGLGAPETTGWRAGPATRAGLALDIAGPVALRAAWLWRLGWNNKARTVEFHEQNALVIDFLFEP